MRCSGVNLLWLRRERDSFREILDCVGDTNFVGRGDKALNASIVMHRRTDIPGIGSTSSPCSAIVRFFMNEAFCAEGSERGGIEIKSSFQSCIR